MSAIDLPVGHVLPNWTPRPAPPRTVLEGRFCRLELLDPGRHAQALFEANSLDKDGRNWTYLSVGPFASLESYRGWLDTVAKGSDPLFHAIVDRKTEKPVGVATFMRIDPPNGEFFNSMSTGKN